MANEDDDGVFKYDDDTKRSAGNDDVKEDIFDDIDDVDDLGTWCSSVDFESITSQIYFNHFTFSCFNYITQIQECHSYHSLISARKSLENQRSNATRL